MIFKIEVLNALVVLLALVVGVVVYRRNRTLETAIAAVAAVAVTLVILFGPNVSNPATGTTAPAPSQTPVMPVSAVPGR
ncbi:hypothetical protein [Streptomyces sp. NPDC058664]|uniref:hypothetical protein n=1 Tax=unclassified Streptomyces TaxID=2593676 RepID=UPI00364B9F6F